MVFGANVTKVKHLGEDLGAAVMSAAVAAARDLAKPGDTVLLAPAAANASPRSAYPANWSNDAAAVRAAIR
ncbi:hypothetical protein MAHJHV55_51820 [Mycobacterium avium subsp. hominissuis]